MINRFATVINQKRMEGKPEDLDKKGGEVGDSKEPEKDTARDGTVDKTPYGDNTVNVDP